jgi:peptidyl-prolyl cis-trans isomerase C
MTAIRVNDAEIPEQAIAQETQNHTGQSMFQAREEAAQALVIRELLLQEARNLGYAPDPQVLGEGKRETDEDSLIRQLLDDQVETPTADEAACRRYYENNIKRFQSPSVYEAAHILFPAPPDDEAARAAAREKAQAAIATLQEHPNAFGELAYERSACPSANEGGRLGQVTRGQTAPELESFMDQLAPGQLCPVPVETRYGIHVLRLDAREDGRQLPFEAVHARIADYLQQQSWNRAVAQYISILAGKARIEGLQMAAANSPLVQ